MPEPIIELRSLSKSYLEGEREHAVLREVDIRIRSGEFVALVGPSGSGKSTLLNVVGGIDEPDTGEVLVDGVELTGLGERDRTLFRRERIGFVFQFFNLIPTLTVEENLLLPLELKGQITAGDRDRARELLDRVGLPDRADSFPDRLSGGEQQRVALARALVHRPAVVLADEPTGNLDEQTGEMVMELMEELVRELGTTLIMVTHARDQAARADRILELHDGRVVEASGHRTGG